MSEGRRIPSAVSACAEVQREEGLPADAELPPGQEILQRHLRHMRSRNTPESVRPQSHLLPALPGFRRMRCIRHPDV